MIFEFPNFWGGGVEVLPLPNYRLVPLLYPECTLALNQNSGCFNKIA